MIGWTNGQIAIGFANSPGQCSDQQTAPAVCQFGYWKTEEQKALRIGSIVAVKEYARIWGEEKDFRMISYCDHPISLAFKRSEFTLKFSQITTMTLFRSSIPLHYGN